MRAAVILALMLTACGSPRQSEAPASVPAAVTFEGAEATDAAARLAHGERMTKVLGCAGCHGDGLAGLIWDDDPKGYGTSWASNLTQAIPQLTDAQLEALLRAGIHPERENLWGMPSELFQHLSGPDMAALILYLRTLKPEGEASPPPILGPRAKKEIATGEVKPAATLVRELRDVLPVDLGPNHALGRYTTQVTCAECHGPKLEGMPNGNPDLIVAGAYSRGEFELLITEGIAKDNRKLKPLMVGVSKGRFSQLTPRERDALYAYLKARADRPQ